ncbi:unnamed protein product, partial [Lampetra fluviatilis]
SGRTSDPCVGSRRPRRHSGSIVTITTIITTTIIIIVVTITIIIIVTIIVNLSPLLPQSGAHGCLPHAVLTPY